MGDKTFVKINSSKKLDTEQILEEILFKGKYTNSEGKTIEFKPNGQIVGLDKFHFYDPIIDYFDEGMQVDQIRIGNSQNELDYYGFKFNKDTLSLYKLNCIEFDSTSNNCGIVEYGQLIHKLWRQE